jgi:hypothetical protein
MYPDVGMYKNDKTRRVLGMGKYPRGHNGESQNPETILYMVLVGYFS